MSEVELRIEPTPDTVTWHRDYFGNEVVFFALPGERTDGHAFLEDAVAAGAAALVVTESLPTDRLAAYARAGVTVVRVEDASEALRAIAAAYRDRFDPLVVGITGSPAKTSTKEQSRGAELDLLVDRLVLAADAGEARA